MSVFTRIRSWLARRIAPKPEPEVIPAARKREKGMILRTGGTGEKQLAGKNEALREGLQGKGGYGWASDHMEETEQYQGWVAVAVSTLVKSAGESTLCVEQLVDEDADEDQELDRKKVSVKHPLVRLLRRPNPAYGWDGLIKRVVMQRALTGTAFVWMIPSSEQGPFGPPCELYVIPTCLVLYAPPTHDMPLGAYRVSASSILSIWGGFSGRFGLAAGGWYVIDARHMLRLSHIHPQTELDGMSPIHLNRIQIDVATQTEQMIWSIIENGAFPAAILSIAANAAGTSDMMNAALAAAQRMIEEEYSGPDRAGKMLPVYGATIQKLAHSLVDALPPEFRTQNRDNVLAMQQTPPSVAGQGDAASYSALHASRQQYIDNAVQPELTDIGSLLTVQLARKFGDDLTVKVEAKPVNDLEMKLKENESLENSQIVTVNEARKRRGLGPHPDPDIGKLACGAVVPFYQSRFGIGPRGGHGGENPPDGGHGPTSPPGGDSGDPAGDGTNSSPGGGSSLPVPTRQNMPIHSLDELAAYRTKGHFALPADHFPFLPIAPGDD